VLEASYVLYFVHSYYNNFAKRISKSPKLYFSDTGFAAYLRGHETEDTFKFDSAAVVYDAEPYESGLKTYLNWSALHERLCGLFASASGSVR
jgi:predicted AAA+ superfamily ATPase